MPGTEAGYQYTLLVEIRHTAIFIKVILAMDFISMVTCGKTKLYDVTPSKCTMAGTYG